MTVDEKEKDEVREFRRDVETCVMRVMRFDSVTLEDDNDRHATTYLVGSAFELLLRGVLALEKIAVSCDVKIATSCNEIKD